MASRPYELLLLDLDGTLVRMDGTISPAVSAAVLKASASLSVSIATGREKSDAIRYAAQLGLTAPQISDNGALIFQPSTGEPLWSAPLGEYLVNEIGRHLLGLEVATIATHAGGTVPQDANISSFNTIRVSALDLEAEEADVLVSRFNRCAGLHVVKVFLPYNRLWAVDLTRAGVSKGGALRKLAAMSGVTPTQIVSVGDSYNDLDMLQSSGLRIVMGGAPEELMAVADYVAPTAEEDGLALAIEEFILPLMGGSG